MTETAETDLLKAAFALIEERGWRAFSLTELARRTGRSLAEVYAELPSRSALLPALARRLDAAMLGLDLAELDGLSPRERVFELVMRRLDAMAPYKGGLKALGREAGGLDLDLVGQACGNVGRVTGWLLDASGADLGELRRAGAGPVLALVYGRVFNVWLDDDTPDQARTLAELDRRLQQAESLAQWTAWLDGSRRRSRPRPEPEPDAPLPV